MLPAFTQTSCCTGFRTCSRNLSALRSENVAQKWAPARPGRCVRKLSPTPPLASAGWAGAGHAPARPRSPSCPPAVGCERSGRRSRPMRAGCVRRLRFPTSQCARRLGESQARVQWLRRWLQLRGTRCAGCMLAATPSIVARGFGVLDGMFHAKCSSATGYVMQGVVVIMPHRSGIGAVPGGCRLRQFAGSPGCLACADAGD